MDILIIIVLGIVQGLTEFLPVSSSGHLVLLENLFNISDASLFLNIVLHCATLLAVVIYYRKKLWQMLKNPFQPIVLYSHPVLQKGFLPQSDALIRHKYHPYPYRR